MKSGKASALRIVVAGYIVGGPLGGLVWHHFQYILGLKRLGHEVLFVEDSNDYASCYNPETNDLSTNPEYGIRFIENIFSKYELGNNWAYYNAHTKNWLGQTNETVKKFCDSAEVFLNLSGINPMREYFQKIPLRVLIDTDPVFTQIRHLTNATASILAEKHNRFFTFGENFDEADCSIPDDSFPWKPTRQPVVMDVWQSAPKKINGPWTTVMQWDSYKEVEYNGKHFRMKSASFEPYLNLPSIVPDSIELAIGNETAPKEKLLKYGWLLTNPLTVTRTPESYKKYIQQSKGEWSIAKHGYVSSRSGWFSERSTCYLACGLPVIIQDTGFSKFMKTGEGLISFTTMDEALAAFITINQDYKRHCQAAKNIAEEYFNSDKVLDHLLRSVFE